MTGRNPYPLKLPPETIDDERQLLGGVLVGDPAFESIKDSISVNDFSLLEHRLIFEAITEMSLAGTPVDVVTTFERLQLNGHVDQAGGIELLVELAKLAVD